MPAKIFVGNLPYGVMGHEISRLFEQYGTVTESAVLGNFGFVVSLNVAIHRYIWIDFVAMLGIIIIPYTVHSWTRDLLSCSIHIQLKLVIDAAFNFLASFYIYNFDILYIIPFLNRLCACLEFVSCQLLNYQLFCLLGIDLLITA